MDKKELKKQLETMGIKVKGNMIHKKDVKKIMASDRMDLFLDAATNSVKTVWEKASGRHMSSNELDRLHVVLSEFFSDTKYNWFADNEDN